MEGFIIVAVIWFVISQIASAKKNEAAKQKGAQAANAQRAQTVKEKPAPAAKPSAARMTKAKPAEGEGLSDKAGCLGGSIAHGAHQGEGPRDKAGCLGGSIAHITHEGEAPYAPAPDAIVPAPRRPAPLGVTAPDMRRAVVMAEVLGKPVSMRRAQPRLR